MRGLARSGVVNSYYCPSSIGGSMMSEIDRLGVMPSNLMLKFTISPATILALTSVEASPSSIS